MRGGGGAVVWWRWCAPLGAALADHDGSAAQAVPMIGPWWEKETLPAMLLTALHAPGGWLNRAC